MIDRLLTGLIWVALLTSLLLFVVSIVGVAFEGPPHLLGALLSLFTLVVSYHLLREGS